MIYSIVCANYISIRLCDLYKSVNQLRPPSSSTTEDDHLVNDPIAWAEVKGGKKGDVLKLVSTIVRVVRYFCHIGACGALYGIGPSNRQLSTGNTK